MYCGEKVRLRAYKEEDIPLATKFVNDRELKKLLVTNIPFPMTNWEEESWIKSQKSNDNGQYNFAIEDIETGKYIGGCGIQNVNWLSRVALVGIMIGDRGKGFGKEALKLMIDYAFNSIHVSQINLDVYKNNPASNLYQKMGFKKRESNMYRYHFTDDR